MLFDQLADTTPLADEVFLKTEETEALAEAISKLAPLYREVVLLYHGNDLSLEEVGEILGVSFLRCAPVKVTKLLFER